MDEFMVEATKPEIEDPLQRNLFGGGSSLADLRDAFREGCKEGTTCPVCDRWGHYDGRPLNTTMVRALAWMWRLSDSGRSWVDVPAALRADEQTYDFSKQYSTVRHWGFLDHRSNANDSLTKESGVWKPTKLAGEFLRGEVAVPERVWTFNTKRVLISDAKVVVGDIVSGFDYWDMMHKDWPPF
jgi:hypothetical protein